MKKVSEIVGGAMMVLALSVLALIWHSYILLCLYDWFLLSYTNVSISFVSMIGINVFVTFLVAKFDFFEKEKEKDKTKNIYYEIGRIAGSQFSNPAIVLGIGYLISLFLN